MNLRDLEYLVALAETKHFRKAAEKCFVSQPGLSGQLKKLEEELGVQLVERTKRKVIFTAAGESLVQRAKRILGEVQEFVEEAKNFENPMQGVLNLGVIPTLAPYLIPLIIAPLTEAYPQLELYLHELQTKTLVAQLEEGSLDVGLLALPVDSSSEEIFLFEEEFWLAVPKSHRLAPKKRAVVDDLEGEKVLLLSEGHCLRDQALSICALAVAEEKTYFKANSLEILRQMVISGGGITLMPQLAINEGTKNSDLIRYIPFKGPSPKRCVGMIFRKTSGRKSGFEEMALLIQSVLGQYLSKDND